MGVGGEVNIGHVREGLGDEKGAWGGGGSYLQEKDYQLLVKVTLQ